MFRRAFSGTALLRSAHSTIRRKTVHDINNLYQNKEKITVLTAFDYISAKIANDAGTDIILVGDSLAMVALGYEDTNEISFDEFLYHCKAVARGVNSSLIVADMPFGSYESSTAKAIESSIKIISKGRANAVKLEGGVEISDTIRSLTDYGIPVVGHVGLTPQRFNGLGGFKVQGKSVLSAQKVVEDALAVQQSGAFAVVLEAIPSPLAEFITDKLTIPTIGIGAGKGTSGQVLVQSDMLGFHNGHTPKFVKKYLNGYQLSVEAVTNYNEEVKSLKFPIEGEHTYKMNQEVLQKVFDAYK